MNQKIRRIGLKRNMPLYEWECLSCGNKKDEFFSISSKPEHIPCDCGATMQFVISAPKAFMDNAQDVPWLREFAATRKEARFGKKPIETRTEYHKYLKDNNLRDPHKGEKGLTEF